MEEEGEGGSPWSQNKAGYYTPCSLVDEGEDRQGNITVLIASRHMYMYKFNVVHFWQAE